MPSFDFWLNRVDELLIRYVGLDSGSLEDWLWRDAYDQGQLPKEAVLEYLDEQGILEQCLPGN